MQVNTENPVDALIVGAGIAGLVCAIELLDLGLCVEIVDRDEPEHRGGLAKESFGGLLLVGTPEQSRAGIVDTPEIALRDWLRFGDFDRSEAGTSWPQRWAERYVQDCAQDVGQWLRDLGLSFLPMPLWVERGQYGEGNSVPRWHVVWGTGQGLVQALLDRLDRHPRRHCLRWRFGVRVEHIHCEGGAVVGVSGAEQATNTPFERRADRVIVAAGGINGSLEMVRKHWHADWGSPPQTLLNGSHRYADGTLHRAAEAVGAQLTHLDRMWNYAAGVHHWRPRKPQHGLSLVPPKSALWLNWRGQRIMAPHPLVSGFDTRDLVTQICHQGPGYSWQVMNLAIAHKELAISGAEFNASIRDKSRLGLVRDVLLGNRALVREFLAQCPDVVVADSVPELVERMNALQGDDAVALEAVQQCIAEYDAQIARGPHLHNDEQLRRIAHLRQYKADRLRTCAFAPIDHAKARPLIAVREFIISRKSLGGIQTDLSSRVLSARGQAIPGLYAVGEAAGFGGGGMNGLRGLEGTFLGGCVYSARRAAWGISGRI